MTGAFQSRVGLEEVWRGRVEKARREYETAKSECQTARLQRGHAANGQPDVDFAVRIALCKETSALHEYARAIRIFKELVIKGTNPEEVV